MDLRELTPEEEKKYKLKRMRKRYESVRKKYQKSLLKRANRSCQKCGYSPEKHKLKPVIFENTPYSPPHLVVDHIVPLSKGGTNKLSNLQILCDKCNGFKALHIGNDSWTYHKKHIRYMLILGYDIEKQELING